MATPEHGHHLEKIALIQMELFFFYIEYEIDRRTSVVTLKIIKINAKVIIQYKEKNKEEGNYDESAYNYGIVNKIMFNLNLLRTNFPRRPNFC